MEVYERAHNEHQTAPSHEESDDAAQTTRRPRVVHVEDDDELRALCADILEEEGFDVVGCPTVLAAQRAIEAQVPDVLLLDRELPDGTGLDVARWVRADPSYACIPIVGFSGRRSVEDVESAMMAGFDVFIGKPCAPSTLVDTIRTMVRADPSAGRRLTGRRKKVVGL